MAAFSAQAREPATHAPHEGPAPAVLSYRRPGALAERSPAPPLPDAKLEDAWLPPCVLRVPDLHHPSMAHSSTPWRWRSHLYWAGIVLGALLALWLIAGGRKARNRTVDEAPAWSNAAASATSAPDIQSVAPIWNDTNPSAGEPPRWRKAATVETAAAPKIEIQPAPPAEPPAEPADSPVTGPALEDAAKLPASRAPQFPPSGIRTALNPEPHRDPPGPRVKPSEAAPLGISTEAPQ